MSGFKETDLGGGIKGFQAKPINGHTENGGLRATYRKQISKYSKLHTFDDFFKNTDENIDGFFANEIFAYHWHSRNNVNIEHNSYYERFENKFKNKIK